MVLAMVGLLVVPNPPVLLDVCTRAVYTAVRAGGGVPAGGPAGASLAAPAEGGGGHGAVRGEIETI